MADRLSVASQQAWSRLWVWLLAPENQGVLLVGAAPLQPEVSDSPPAIFSPDKERHKE